MILLRLDYWLEFAIDNWWFKLLVNYFVKFQCNTIMCWVIKKIVLDAYQVFKKSLSKIYLSNTSSQILLKCCEKNVQVKTENYKFGSTENKVNCCRRNNKTVSVFTSWSGSSCRRWASGSGCCPRYSSCYYYCSSNSWASIPWRPSKYHPSWNSKRRPSAAPATGNAPSAAGTDPPSSPASKTNWNKRRRHDLPTWGSERYDCSSSYHSPCFCFSSTYCCFCSSCCFCSCQKYWRSAAANTPDAATRSWSAAAAAATDDPNASSYWPIQNVNGIVMNVGTEKSFIYVDRSNPEVIQK